MPRRRAIKQPPPVPTSAFTILADFNELQRHHKGWRFSSIDPPVRVVTANLSVGDYTVLGLEDRIRIERKSKADLYGSVARRADFIRKLELLSAFDYAAIIVEAGYSDTVVNPPKYAGLHPRSLSGSVIAWRQRFPKVDWWFLEDVRDPATDTVLTGAELAERAAFRILERFYNDATEGRTT